MTVSRLALLIPVLISGGHQVTSQKSVVTTPAHQQEAKATQPEPYKNPDLLLRQRVDDLFSKLKTEEKFGLITRKSPAIERLGIPAFNWSADSSVYGETFPSELGMGSSFDRELLSLAGSSLVAPQGAGQVAGVPVGLIRDARVSGSGASLSEDPAVVAQLAAAFVHGAQGDDPRNLRSVASLTGLDAWWRPVDVTSAPMPSRDLALTTAAPVLWCVQQSLPLCFSPGTFGGLRLLDTPVPWLFDGLVVAPDLPIPVSAPSTPKKSASADAVRVVSLQTPRTPPASKPEPTMIDLVNSGCVVFADAQIKAMQGLLTKGEIKQAQVDSAVRKVIEIRLRGGLFARTKSNAKKLDSAAITRRAAEESLVLLKNDPGVLPLSKSLKAIAVIGPNADDPAALTGRVEAADSKIETPLSALKTLLGSTTKVTYERGTGISRREDLETMNKDVIPDGLVAEFYDSSDFTGTPVTDHVEQVDEHWKGAPIAGITSPKFTASWSGSVIPPSTGHYEIGISVEGSARLYLDDQLVIDEWKDGPLRTKTVPVDLETGQFYPIRLEYAHGASAGSIRLLWIRPQTEPFHAALTAARGADAIVLFLGQNPGADDAGLDRKTLGLSDAQQSLLRQVLEFHKPTVVVLLNHDPISVDTSASHSVAVVEAWCPGAAGGKAIADLLLGEFSPSGKMPVSVYREASQLPQVEDLDPTSRGYRYSLFRPLFPFGFGLSYAKFSYGDLVVPSVFDPAKPLRVGVTVKNASNREGDETVELYVSHEKPSSPMPRLALKVFRRVHLGAHESKRIFLNVLPADLAVIHEDGSAWVEPEPIRISVGGNLPQDDLPPVLSAHTRANSAKPFKPAVERQRV